MRMETEFNLIKVQLIDDGMGGYIEDGVYGTYWSFKGKKMPIKVEHVLEEYGIVSTRALKIFTKEALPEEIELIQEPLNDFQKYKLLQLMDYGKYRMLLVEEVD